MRDPDRIDEIVEALKKEWKNHPDWRLCQLFINLDLMPRSLHFHTSDDKVLRKLKEGIDNGEN